MRLYVDLDMHDPVLTPICDLVCANDNLDICEVSNLPGNPMKNATEVFAMNWRFFPTLDPQVSLTFIKVRLGWVLAHFNGS